MIAHRTKSILLTMLILGVAFSIPGHLEATERIVVGEMFTNTS